MAMNVSITLTLQDQFTNRINGIINSLNQLKAAAAGLNKAFSAQSLGSGFTGLNRQVATLNASMQRLAQTASQVQRSLGSAMVGGGMSGQGQLATMRQMVQMQQQMIANAQRLNVVQNRGHGGGAPASWLGRSGFHPNASAIDRAQYRGVNLAEQTMVEGALGMDKARTNLLMKGISDTSRMQAERYTAQWSKDFPELTRAGVMDTVGEIITQFKDDGDAFRMLPELLKIQRVGVYGGDTASTASKGMLELVRAVGLTGRLTDSDGKFNHKATAEFLDAYMRAKVVGGADINPSQVFQLVKYMKTPAQGMSSDAWLQAMIAMPDLRGSTFGNSLNMAFRNLTGKATKEAQAAQFNAGLLESGGIDPNHPAGPRKFKGGALKEEELMRTDPGAWIKKYLMEGYLRDKLGYDLKTISAAQIAKEIKPLFSNSSAENIINQYINQFQEWQNQIKRAEALKMKDPAYWKQLRDQSGWVALIEARSQLVNVMSSVSENFKFMLPAIHAISDALGKVAGILDPKTGSTAARAGLIGGGLIGGGLLARLLLSRAGPLGRMIAGGAAGGLVSGDITGMLLGGLLARGVGLGGGSIAGAATGGMLARMGLRMAGMLRGVFITSLAGLGITMITGVLGEMVSGWDSKKGVLENITGGLRKYFTDLREQFAQAMNELRMGKAHAEEAKKPGHEEAGNGKSAWEIYQEESKKRLEELKLNPPAPKSRIFGALSTLGGIIWRNTLGSTPAEGADMQRPSLGMEGQTGVPGLFLGSMPGSLNRGGPSASADLGTQITSAAAEAAAQIRAAGGTLAGAIHAVAGQVGTAGNALAAQAATVGAASKGVLGNQSRAVLGDK